MEEQKLVDLVFHCGKIELFHMVTHFPSVVCACIAGDSNKGLGQIFGSGDTFTSAVDKAYDELQVRVTADKAKLSLLRRIKNG